jgi:tRNA A37 threonylcarbamoyladenosine dehydratase
MGIIKGTMRFSRTQLLLGEEGMRILSSARIAIFGIGGVGGYALEAVARAGVGRLFIVDFDLVGETNINRQILALSDSIGLPKVSVAEKRVEQINPDVEIDVVREFISPDKTASIIPDDLDYAIDAIDGVNTKVHLILGLLEKRIDFISCMGAASRLVPTGIRVSDISETRYCPLARKIRKRLRRYGISEGVKCVYSEENLKSVFEPDEIEKDALEETIQVGRRRRIQGSISYVPGIIGMTAAGVAINDVLRSKGYKPSSRL